VNDGGTGVAASLAFTPNDYWTFRGTVDTSSNETPLQATLCRRRRAARVRGSDLALQRIAQRPLYYAHMDFSDNNRRDITRVRWTERVISGPVIKA